MKKIFLILLLTTLGLCTNNLYANEEKESFNVGNTIMQHLGDEHSWEICSIKGHEIAIPLPVILINDGVISVFMSNKKNNS